MSRGNGLSLPSLADPNMKTRLADLTLGYLPNMRR
jgi:hypothetical protein